MVIILKMTVGKVLWLVGLFTATAFAYNSTCTDLSWGSKVKREKITLHNSGNVSYVCLHNCITTLALFYSIF